jgi:hypothetical protein
MDRRNESDDDRSRLETMGCARMSARSWIVALGIAALTAAVLLWMGRNPICECGYVKFWHGETVSSENSQHIADWYTPSHILHGLIFYAFLWLILRRASLGTRFVIATAIEAAWEVAENTNAVIERYREATIALDYYGDSVLNSMADLAWMWVGFALARVLPVWVSVLLFIAAELIVGYFIRDGLTLNVIMLLAPQDWIREWQMAG